MDFFYICKFEKLLWSHLFAIMLHSRDIVEKFENAFMNQEWFLIEERKSCIQQHR